MVQDIVWSSYLEVAPETSAAAISALETTLGVDLPEDYKQALAEHAGEVTTPATMPVGERSGAPFGPLLHLAPDADQDDMSYALSNAREDLREWGGGAAARLVPVASDTASGYFCLDYRQGQTNPPVVFIDMTYAPDDKGAILPVAPSFSAALDRLYQS